MTKREKQFRESVLYSNVAEIQVSYKPKRKVSECPTVKDSVSTERYLRLAWSENIEFIEEFMLLILNRANRVLGHVVVSKGGIAGTVADVKIIIGTAMKACATSIILAHNHPSGNLAPSKADIDLTRKIRQACDLVEISLLDHIILSAESFYSFADDGKL